MFEGYGGPIQMDRADLDGIDPSLDACCQREVEGSRRQAALQNTLRRHDRIALAERRKRNLINSMSFGSGCRCCYEPNSDGGEYLALANARSLLPPKEEDEGHAAGHHTTNDYNVNGELNHKEDSKQNYNDSDDDDSDDDSEFDYLLDDDLPGMDNIQQDRIEELQLSAMMRESAIQHGFGVHRQMSASRVLQAAGLGINRKNNNNRNSRYETNTPAAIPPAVVLHFFDGMSNMSASLDLYLEELADTKYFGTKFLRADGRATLLNDTSLIQEVFPTQHSLRIESDLPALVAIRDGVVIAISSKLVGLGIGGIKDGTVEHRAVEEWLDKAGVLLEEVPIAFEDYCRIRPEEDALLENMMREKAKLNEVQDLLGFEEEKEMYHNCGVPGCQKTFRHEHVGIQNAEQCGVVVNEDLVTPRPSDDSIAPPSSS